MNLFITDEEVKTTTYTIILLNLFWTILMDKLIKHYINYIKQFISQTTIYSRI